MPNGAKVSSLYQKRGGQVNPITKRPQRALSGKNGGINARPLLSVREKFLVEMHS